MRKVHRYLALVAVAFGLYVGTTGTLIQLVDLRTILGNAPANDPEMQAIRDGRDGPPNFQVLQDSDFGASELPADFDFDRALGTVIASKYAEAGAVPMKFIELRMAGDRPVGQVSVADKLLRIDAVTGEVLAGLQSAPPASLPPAGNRASVRNTLKNIHRMTAYGKAATVVFFALGLVFFVMIVTGLTMYWRMWSSRYRGSRRAPLWIAGGWWRTVHRAAAIGASICLLWVALTGLLCAMGSLGVAYYQLQTDGVRPGLRVDASSPLPELRLPSMLRTTLDAYGESAASAAIKVVRLRYFAGMPQGVVVYGEPDTRQLAFNADTGRTASLSGPGYPRTGQTFGWQGDQVLKGLHRGDFIGMPGRWLSLLSGLALLFMSVSGAVLYGDLRKKQRKVSMRT